MKKNNDSDILRKADKLVSVDRQKMYGHPYNNFTDIANIASAITGKYYTALDCVDILIATKLAREKNKHGDDNLIDTAGYIKVKAMIIEKMNKKITNKLLSVIKIMKNKKRRK